MVEQPPPVLLERLLRELAREQHRRLVAGDRREEDILGGELPLPAREVQSPQKRPAAGQRRGQHRLGLALDDARASAEGRVGPDVGAEDALALRAQHFQQRPAEGALDPRPRARRDFPGLVAPQKSHAPLGAQRHGQFARATLKQRRARFRGLRRAREGRQKGELAPQGRLGLARHVRPVQPKRLDDGGLQILLARLVHRQHELAVAHADAVAVLEPRRIHGRVVDEGVVAAAEIRDDPAAFLPAQLAVAPGHGLVRQHDVAFGIAPDRHALRVQAEALAAFDAFDYHHVRHRSFPATQRPRRVRSNAPSIVTLLTTHCGRFMGAGETPM